VSADFSRVGLAVGHATDDEGRTGLTVVRGVDGPFRGAVAIVGRATGSRELHALAADSLADRVDAILLTGGSAYGLDATAGVMRWMEERGRGFPIAGGVVPIVPAAVIFDLDSGHRFHSRPTAEMAYAATDAARRAGIAEGSVGAGAGATVGKAAGAARAMKGGVGCAECASAGVAVAAVAVVNAWGDVRGGDGEIIAGARAPEGGFLDAARVLMEAPERLAATAAESAMRNTTLAVVATTAVLDRVQLAGLARAASAALYRRITPVATPFDGDLVFALCPRDGPSRAGPHVEALAVAALEQAIERAVRLAVGRGGIPGCADRA
jgi:L-aminopeptidase/D-esterase-like protein